MADNNSGGFKGWMSGWNKERISGWFSGFNMSSSKNENDGSMAVEKVSLSQKMEAQWSKFAAYFPKKKAPTPNEDGTIPASDSTYSKLSASMKEKFSSLKQLWGKGPKKIE